MATEEQSSRAIDGKGRSVRELLGNRKYSIDYYQRDYKWQKKQLTELIDDLSGRFLANHEPGNDRGAVAEYGHYFLGSVIISDKDGQKFIVDGQQRLTTLTLLLIFIRHRLEDDDHRRQLGDLICSVAYGKKSFNLDVPERTPVMEALYEGSSPNGGDNRESLVNIEARYSDLEECFPEELSGDTLPYFADWLMENVQLVEITAYSDSDAYAIFETMNDRGLSLTPADMLKGYLLAQINDADRRERATQVWKERVRALADLGKDEDADGIKAWLRSQHAESIRERKRGAQAQDFDLIGTEFHRWVRDHRERLGLSSASAFQRFIERDFSSYGRLYERLRGAASTRSEELDRVFYNAQHNFTLQYTVMMAPVTLDDDPATVTRKLRVVSTYLDIFITRRLWNFKAIDYSAMQYAMFTTLRDIRGLGVDALVERLDEKLRAVEGFGENPGFRLHGMNGPAVHRILARLTDYVEVQSGGKSRYEEYATRSGKLAYEIEHIWADHPERHEDEFGHQTEFSEYRNRIGGLLLLPKQINASLGDMHYEQKLERYDSGNLLARSLNENAYRNNPGFVTFVKESGLDFRPHEGFKRDDLDRRQALYAALAERVWSVERLAEAAL